MTAASIESSSTDRSVGGGARNPLDARSTAACSRRLRCVAQQPNAPVGRIATAMVTPFTPEGAVDLTAVRRLARHLVEHGSEGLVLTGTTGEAPTLRDDEKVAIWRAVVDEVGGDAHVVAGTGTYDT